MPQGDPIVVGIFPGVFHLQEGSGWNETQWGLDEGHFSWETHVLTPRSSYPKIGDVSSALPTLGPFNRMYIIDVKDAVDASGKVVRIDATYSGSMNPGAVKKQKISPAVDTSIFNLPTLPTDTKINVVARVPKLRVTREYVTTTQPTYAGVSETYSATFLPSLPSFTITFVPDPDEPQTVNYSNGWKLDNREWEPVADAVWHVRESINYYWNLAV